VSVESHGDGGGDDDDDAGWGETVIRPLEISDNSTGRDMWQRVGRRDERVKILRISI
jgi:hypothetical protein